MATAPSTKKEDSPSSEAKGGTAPLVTDMVPCPYPIKIEVTVKTRLGRFLLPGAKVRVVEGATIEGEGLADKTTDETATYTHGKYFNANGIKDLVIEAVYENPAEKLLKETARLYISDLGAVTPKPIKAENIIRRIQDVKSGFYSTENWETALTKANEESSSAKEKAESMEKYLAGTKSKLQVSREEYLEPSRDSIIKAVNLIKDAQGNSGEPAQVKKTADTSEEAVKALKKSTELLKETSRTRGGTNTKTDAFVTATLSLIDKTLFPDIKEIRDKAEGGVITPEPGNDRDYYEIVDIAPPVLTANAEPSTAPVDEEVAAGTSPASGYAFSPPPANNSPSLTATIKHAASALKSALAASAELQKDESTRQLKLARLQLVSADKSLKAAEASLDKLVAGKTDSAELQDAGKKMETAADATISAANAVLEEVKRQKLLDSGSEKDANLIKPEAERIKAKAAGIVKNSGTPETKTGDTRLLEALAGSNVSHFTISVKQEGEEKIKVLHVTMLMATFSLDVPYVSQVIDQNISLGVLDGTHIYRTIPKSTSDEKTLATTNDHRFSGSRICAAASLTMLYSYFDMIPDQADVLWSVDHHKNITFEQAVTAAKKAVDSATPKNKKTAEKLLEEAETKLKLFNNLPAIPTKIERVMVVVSNLGDTKDSGRITRFNAEGARAWQCTDSRLLSAQCLISHKNKASTIPKKLSEFPILNFTKGRISNSKVTEVLKAGQPILSSIVGSHILIVRGAVINREGMIIRTICNDPQGTLAGPKSALAWYGDGEGEINAPIPLGKKPNTLTQQLGKHVYYRGSMNSPKMGTTTKSNQTFQFQYASLYLNITLSNAEVQKKLIKQHE